jgi:hypothetical protein
LKGNRLDEEIWKKILGVVLTASLAVTLFAPVTVTRAEDDALKRVTKTHAQIFSMARRISMPARL